MSATATEEENNAGLRNRDDDTWIDRWLDYLRENRMHPILEVILSWLVCVACLIYYFYSYLKEAASASHKRAVLSPAETTYFPSGLKATDRT